MIPTALVVVQTGSLSGELESEYGEILTRCPCDDVSARVVGCRIADQFARLPLARGQVGDGRSINPTAERAFNYSELCYLGTLANSLGKRGRADRCAQLRVSMATSSASASPKRGCSCVSSSRTAKTRRKYDWQGLLCYGKLSTGGMPVRGCLPGWHRHCTSRLAASRASYYTTTLE